MNLYYHGMNSLKRHLREKEEKERDAQENAVLKRAAFYLPKHKVDVVAQFADSLNIYVLHYAPLSDEWTFSNGETISTMAIIYYIGGLSC